MHIPFFREILLESFFCEHCGYKNATIKSAGEIQEKGSKFTFRIDCEADFQRQVVKNDSAIFKIEDLDLEMPSGQGQLTNLEGLLSKILGELKADQPQRKTENFQLYTALDGIIQKLITMMNGSSFPFSVSLDDPSGNSLIEPSLSDRDAKYIRTDYPRTHAQNVLIGLAADEDEDDNENPTEAPDPLNDVDIIDGQIYEIPPCAPAAPKTAPSTSRKSTSPTSKTSLS